MKKTFLVTILFGLISALSFAAAKNTQYITPVPQGGQISIKKSQLTKDASFINYKSGEITVQLIAVIADDNSFRVAFNTCQSCNPAPKAYFVQQGRKLECQNCGNQFTMNDVGSPSYGCNPARIPFTQTDSEILISTEILEKAAPEFRNWQGSVK